MVSKVVAALSLVVLAAAAFAFENVGGMSASPPVCPAGQVYKGIGRGCGAVNLGSEVTSTLSLPNGGTNNAALSNCAGGQVLNVVGGQVQCINVPQAQINAARAIHVDQTGTDIAPGSGGCGPINAPCRTITGTNGAHAQVLAANDNGATTCQADNSQNCMRCNGTATLCNELSDCTGTDPNAVCSNYTCSNSTTEGCGFRCVTSSHHCLIDGDCPYGDTCNRTCTGGSNAGGHCNSDFACPLSTCDGVNTCSNQSGPPTCRATNANSACGGGACQGPQKQYAVIIGGGSYPEVISPICSASTLATCTTNTDCTGAGQFCYQASGGRCLQFCTQDTDCTGNPNSVCTVASTTMIPSPGFLTYSSEAGGGNSVSATILNGTSVIFDQGGGVPANADVTNRTNINFQYLNLNNANDNVVSRGNAVNINILGGGLNRIGSGWGLNMNGRGNHTVAMNNAGTFNLSGTDRDVHWQSYPTSCSVHSTQACSSDADCANHPGETCSLLSSSDFIIYNSFLQPTSGGTGDASIWIEGLSCGINFHTAIDTNDYQIGAPGVLTDQYRPQIIKTSETSCDPNTVALLQHQTLVTVSALRVLPVQAPAQSWFTHMNVGTNTTMEIGAAGVQYDACRRVINGTVKYSSNSKICVGGTFAGLACTSDGNCTPNGRCVSSSFRGGGNADLGVLDCDQPQTPPLIPPVISAVGFATGGSLSNGTGRQCQVSATNAIGESLPSIAVTQAASGCSSSCQITPNWATVPDATGYKVYCSTLAGDPNGVHPIQLVSTLSGWNNTTYTYTGAAAPTTNVPTTDTSFVQNPQDGECWYSTTKGARYCRVNGTVGPTVIGGVNTLQWSRCYVWSPDFHVLQSSDTFLPFEVPVAAGATTQLKSVDYAIGTGGSVHIATYQNGSTISGLDALVATTTSARATPNSTVNVADGDKFKIALSTPGSSPAGISFCFNFSGTMGN